MLYQEVWTDSKNIQATPFESSLKWAVSRGTSLGWNQMVQMTRNERITIEGPSDQVPEIGRF